MSSIKLFSLGTCLELLDFKTNGLIRDLYNQEVFNYEQAQYLKDTISINPDGEGTVLGTRPTDDLKSAIRIFTILKELDPVQANDKRLWVTLTHTIFYKYVKERWGIGSDASDNVIRDRFHFEGAGLRARNQNSLARLWWAAKITYDENRKDPFELTRFLWDKQDFYQNLIDRKFSTYKGTLFGFLKFYSRNKHIDLKTEMRKLFKGLNAFGGVRVLSLMDETEIESELYKLCNFYKIRTDIKQ